MSCFFYKEKRLGKIIVGIITCMTMICHACPAQNNHRLPDSVSIDDTVSGEDKIDNTNTIAADTVDQVKTVPDDSITFRAVPDSVIAAYKKDRNFEYANNPAYWIKEPVSHEKNFLDRIFEWFSSKWFSRSLFVVLGSVLLFALYKIIKENKLYMFYSSARKQAVATEDEMDMTYENINEKIRKAIDAGDFRNALRYMYLKALRMAGDKELIHFHAQGTNQEYITQMINQPGEKDFRLLTHAYEYVWYGGFVLTHPQFETLRVQFDKFYNIIEHWGK